jgi:hypothetical protein
MSSCAPAWSRFRTGGIDWSHGPKRAWSFAVEKKRSMAQLEPLGDRLIARQVGVMEIIQQAAALPDHFEQATTGTVILDVLLQMFGQVIDALGQESDLHVSRPCVALVQPEPRYRLSFFHIFFSINFL